MLQEHKTGLLTLRAAQDSLEWLLGRHRLPEKEMTIS